MTAHCFLFAVGCCCCVDLTSRLFSVVGGSKEDDVDHDGSDRIQTVLLLALQPSAPELKQPTESYRG